MTFHHYIAKRSTTEQSGKSLLTKILRLKLPRQEEFQVWGEFHKWLLANNAMPHTVIIAKALWRDYERSSRKLLWLDMSNYRTH